MRFAMLCFCVLIVAGLALALGIVALAIAAPDRKPPLAPEAKPDPVIPYIAGVCRFGVIVQDGRKLRIEGDCWYVEKGAIDRDGKTLSVQWVQRESGRLAIGIYRIGDDGSIIGNWNWADSVTEDADGTLHGVTTPETLREPIVPDL